MDTVAFELPICPGNTVVAITTCNYLISYLNEYKVVCAVIAQPSPHGFLLFGCERFCEFIGDVKNSLRIGLIQRRPSIHANNYAQKIVESTINNHMRYDVLQSPVIQEGVHDVGIFKAVFMAGSPGSGKSTVRRILFGGMGFKTVDADEIRAAWIKLGREGDYQKYGEIVRKQRQSYMDQRLGLIMDTTAWWLPSIKETTHQLQDMGYDVGMVHVWTPLDVAMNRVTSRAQLTGREVPEEEITKRYQALKDNTKHYAEMFGDHYWFVDNSGEQPKLDRIQRSMLRWIKSPPSSPIAQQWIASQKPVGQPPK